ncbi:MAG: hypothetical protein HY302_06990 [Opitutae bacterium]|nr:hypothetical protein [Opitutae bacterium]
MGKAVGREGPPHLLLGGTAVVVRRDSQHLGRAGLPRDRVFARVAVEKPLGCDQESARALNTVRAASFEEAQIFRIDRCLGNETVPNLLAFRLDSSRPDPPGSPAGAAVF